MKNIFYLVFFSLIFYSCATIVPPSGGEKDSEPPKLIKTYPYSGSVNIYPNKITFIFNENIELKNKSDNIIISPSLNFKPKLIVKKNKLYLYIPSDSLKQNTTYFISFNNCISDIYEGNTIDNFNFSFSTGFNLDSFSIRCKCIDNYSNNTIADCKGILNNNKSTYKSLSDDEGNLNFFNLNKDTFLLTAFVDKNKNNILDNKELYYFKKIYFDSSRIINLNKIYLFNKKPSDTLILNVINANYVNQNTISIKFNRYLNSNDEFLYEINDKSYKKQKSLIPTKENDSFLIHYSFIEADTIVIKTKTNRLFQEFLIKQPKNKTKQHFLIDLKTPLINLNYPVILKSTLPIELINSDLISINGNKPDLDVELLNSNKIIIKNLITFPSQIIFNKGSITDINRKSDYTDTFIVNLLKPEESGNLTLIFSDTTNTYKGKILISLSNENYNYSLSTSIGKPVKFNSLFPGNYDIEIVLDENNNDKYDSGDYFEGSKPERIIKLLNYFKIKPNWDIENVNININ